MYVDVHTHLSHESFRDDIDQVIDRAKLAGLGAIVVNGLEPQSNRWIHALSKKHAVIKAAFGIYPIDAVAHLRPKLPFEVTAIDTTAELQWIEANVDEAIALGECGLDGYYLDESTYAEQEKVFHGFIDIALAKDKPLIIHSRKLEDRVFEILKDRGVKRVNMHCYGGKVKAALRVAKEEGWYFSIPAHSRRSQSFSKLLAELPQDRILTETDAPYLSPEPGKRNEPANVTGTVQHFAELRQWDLETAKQQIYSNYKNLFAG